MPTPMTIDFDAGCSNGGDGDITSYTWDFGDGNTDTGPTVSHTYADSTPYTVTLTVVGSAGSADTTAIVSRPLDHGWSSAGSPLTTVTTDLDPQVMLRISNDAGRTWISEQWRSAGKIGDWSKRIRWNGLGSARRRVFEVVVTDPVPWRLVGADLQISQSGAEGRK